MIWVPGPVRMFWPAVFERDSIDGHGMSLIANEPSVPTAIQWAMERLPATPDARYGSSGNQTDVGNIFSLLCTEDLPGG
jgi:hypothetical protein